MKKKKSTPSFLYGLFCPWVFPGKKNQSQVLHLGCFVRKFSLERKISPRFFLCFVLSLNFHCQPDASTFVGIISRFYFLDYQLQTNHGVHVWKRQNRGHGKHWSFGKLLREKWFRCQHRWSCRAGDASKLCLGMSGHVVSLFYLGGVPCSPSVFVEGVWGSKGHPEDFRPRERAGADVWVNRALKPAWSLQPELQSHGIRS